MSGKLVVPAGHHWKSIYWVSGASGKEVSLSLWDWTWQAHRALMDCMTATEADNSGTGVIVKGEGSHSE
jgi:hypothetical protein